MNCILEIVIADRILFYALEKRHEEIELAEGKIIINRIKERWQVRTSGDLLPFNKEVIMHTLVSLGTQNGKKIIIILTSQSEDKYSRISLKNKIVCAAHQADIIFHSPLLQNCILMIHSDGRITGKGTSLFSLDGKPIKEDSVYHNGSEIRFLNVRMFLHTAFIEVNETDTLSAAAEIWHPAYTGEKIPLFPISHKRFPYAFLPEDHIDLKVRPPILTSQCETGGNSMVGSSLVMASASMTGGILMAYRSYMAGRQWLEIVPMMIFPVAMMLSLFILRPLQSFLLKRQKRKELREEEDTYIQYVDHLKKEVEEQKQKIAAAYDFVYPLSDQEGICVERGSTIRIGTIQKCLAGTVALPDYYQCATERIRQAVNSLKVTLEEPVNFPMLIHLEQYHTVTIASRNRESIMKNILYGLLNGSDVVKTAVSHNLKEIDEILYCRQLYTREGRRRIIQALDSTMYEDCYVFMPEELVIQKESGCLISYSEEIQGDMHIACNDDGSYTAYDLVNQKSTLFSMDKMNAVLAADDFIPSVFARQNDLLSLYEKVNAKDLSLSQIWSEPSQNEHLIARLGRDTQGRLIQLDLSEKGDGPHGLIAGTTGSGKSELILTLLLTLAINYSPHEVNFILIDFKGGGCAQALRTEKGYIPHVAGVLCNLDVNEMDRALIALRNECLRREKLFNELHLKSGQNIRNLNDYRLKWKEHKNFAELADLVIVIDEFAELKSSRPDFMDDLISIARVGRSLGMHLILSTQKPAGIVNDQIWANTNFKICMKVASRQDSMEVLHHDAAAYLNAPGSFVLTKNGSLIQGQAGYSHAYETKPRITEFDIELKPKKNDLLPVNSPLQSEAVCDLIQKTSSYQAKTLWKDPLGSLSWSMFKDAQGVLIGLIDDIHSCSYRPFRIENQNMYVITMDHQEKEKFLRTLITALAKDKNTERDITIIDDLHFNISHDFSVFCSDESEKIKQLDTLLQKKDRRKLHTIIITDVSSFKEKGEQYLPLTMYLGHPEEYLVQFILIGIRTSSLSYRHLSLISLRCTLKNENSQDIAALFEKAGRRTVNKGGQGMINDKWCSTFSLIETKMEDMHE